MKTAKGEQVEDVVVRMGEAVARELNGEGVPAFSYILMVAPFRQQADPSENRVHYMANMDQNDVYMVMKTQLAVMEGRVPTPTTKN